MNNDFFGRNDSSHKSDSPGNGNSPESAICALILAAGLSTRMTPLLKGGSKALCTLQGEMLLERCCNLFRGLGIEDIYVVTGHEEERVKAVAAKLGMRTVHNADFKEGMLSSIKAGIRALEELDDNIFPQTQPGATTSPAALVFGDAWKPEQYDAFFLLPVDIPLVSPAVVQHLLDYWGSLDSCGHHQSSELHESHESKNLYEAREIHKIRETQGLHKSCGIYRSDELHDSSGSHSLHVLHCSECSQRASRQGTLLIPEADGHPGHPPLIGRAHWPAILGWGGEGGLQGYVASLGETVTADGRCVQRVEVGDEKVLWDIDTPEDFEKADRYIKDTGA